MNRIRDLRIARGWTQEQLGLMLNVQKAAVSKYENETAFPSKAVLMKLSTIFNVSLDYLLCNEHYVNPEENHIPKEQARLWKIFNSLSGDGKKLFKGMLESLLKSHSKKESNVTQKNSGGYNILNVNSGNNSVTLI